MNITPWNGKPVSKPGCYSGIPIRVYHSAKITAGPCASSGGLREIHTTSPAHYWAWSPYNPEAVPKESTEAMKMGRAAHHLFLGEKGFAAQYTVRPDTYRDQQTGEQKKWNGNATVCKQWMEKAAKSRKETLTSDDIARLRGMAASLSANPLVRGGILAGKIEHSLIWKDKESGLWLRARPDAIPTASGDYADLKLTADIMRTDRTAQERRLDMQAALVRMGCRALGMEFASFTLIFLESERPHIVETHRIDDVDLDAAEDDLRAAIKVFAYCMKHGRWFGPSGTQRDLRAVYFPSGAHSMRERAKFRRELLLKEIES